MKHYATWVAGMVVAGGLGISAANGSEPLFRAGDNWAVIGDSITHGRRYHSFIYLFYATRHPDRPFRLHNCGISGDSASGAVLRYSWDIGPREPSVATIMLGMNDVGRGLYGKGRAGEEVAARRRDCIDRHVKAMEQLSELLARDSCRIVYITPSIYDQTGTQAAENCFGVNDALGECGRRVALLAPRFDAQVAEVHGPMTELNREVQRRDPDDTLVGADRVHPGDVGQFVMAYLFLKSVGASGRVAIVDIDASADGVVRAENCALGISERTPAQVEFTYAAESLPYPVPGIARPALAVVPFAEELNRETLRVAGLEAGTYAVLIDGEVVCIHSAAELAAGIDLAANPRSPMLRQAETVMELNEQRHRIGARLRTLAAQRHWICRRYPDVPPEDFEAMKTAILTELEKKKSAANFGYFKGQADAYIETKPIEHELVAEMNELTDAMWRAAAPRPHTVVIRRATEEDRAARHSVVIDEFTSYDGWTFTGWTEGEPAVQVQDGRLTVTAPRVKEARDMLGLTRRTSVDLGGSAVLEIRMRAEKGSPFGVEAVLDGALKRLRNYVPASGDWESVRLPVEAGQMSSLTLILAEPSAAALWNAPTATYEFDRIRVELQKAEPPAY